MITLGRETMSRKIWIQSFNLNPGTVWCLAGPLTLGLLVGAGNLLTVVEALGGVSERQELRSEYFSVDSLGAHDPHTAPIDAGALESRAANSEFVSAQAQNKNRLAAYMNFDEGEA